MSEPKIKVWIDQDLCTGDGLCAEICPEIFEMHTDGLAYVKFADWPDIYNRQDKEPLLQMTDMADVPDELLQAVIESAEECPGECIFLQTVES
jgi:ferredoxin